MQINALQKKLNAAQSTIDQVNNEQLPSKK